MRATRRTYLAFLITLVMTTVASGWLVSLALALRRQGAGLEDLALGAAGVPLLLAGLLVISRILYRTRQSEKQKGGQHEQVAS